MTWDCSIKIAQAKLFQSRQDQASKEIANPGYVSGLCQKVNPKCSLELRHEDLNGNTSGRFLGFSVAPLR